MLKNALKMLPAHFFGEEGEPEDVDGMPEQGL